MAIVHMQQLQQAQKEKTRRNFFLDLKSKQQI